MTGTALLIALHMGGLHPFEQALTLALAFGPFLLLGALIVHRRRQEAREARVEEAGPQRER